MYAASFRYQNLFTLASSFIFFLKISWAVHQRYNTQSFELGAEMSTDMFTTMSIASFGACTIPKPETKVFSNKQTNRIDDIKGAQPARKFDGDYSYKQDVMKVDDIKGARSNPLIWTRENVPDRSLLIDDIEGTRCKIAKGMSTTNRHVNPLIPEYKLPSFEAASPTITKSRAELEAFDVKSPKFTSIAATRDSYGVADILGAQPGWRPTGM